MLNFFVQFLLVFYLSESGFLHKNCISSSLIQIDVRKSHRWLCTELLIQSFFFLAGVGAEGPRTFGQLLEGKSRLAKPTFAYRTYIYPRKTTFLFGTIR